MERSGRQALKEVLWGGDTVVVASLDQFSRHFGDRVMTQTDLIRPEICILAVREDIDTREGSAAAKLFRRLMLAQGGC